MKRIVGLLGAVALPTLMAGNAQAATAIYTISGTGSGVLNGNSFKNSAFTFTLTGDTTNLVGGQIGPLTTATAAIAGFGTTTFSIGTVLGFNSGNNAVYFGRSGGYDLFDFFTATPVNLGSSFSSLGGSNVFALNQFQNVATSGGALTFNTSSNVQFSGSVGASAVPEPATWAMLLVGFGAVGVMMRRARKTTTSVSFT